MRYLPTVFLTSFALAAFACGSEAGSDILIAPAVDSSRSPTEGGSSGLPGTSTSSSSSGDNNGGSSGLPGSSTSSSGDTTGSSTSSSSGDNTSSSGNTSSGNTSSGNTSSGNTSSGNTSSGNTSTSSSTGGTSSGGWAACNDDRDCGYIRACVPSAAGDTKVCADRCIRDKHCKHGQKCVWSDSSCLIRVCR